MGKFSEKDRKVLLSNQYVVNVTDGHVTFTVEFKKKAVELNLQGMSPQDIFNKLGIDTSLFLDAYPKKSIGRWKKIFLEEGVEGLAERRGKNSPGRPKRSDNPETISALKQRLIQLEAENYVLKKLHALAANSRKKKDSK